MAMFQIKERTSQKVTANSRKKEKTFITQIARKQMEYSYWMLKESLTKGLSNKVWTGFREIKWMCRMQGPRAGSHFHAQA